MRNRSPIFAAILFVLLLGLGYAATVSPLFHARTIRVSGLNHLKEPKVLQMAGVDGGTNVLWLSGRGVADRLATDPWVMAASVAKSYPSTLTITITERTPAALVGQESGFALVAGDGTVLDRLSRAPRLPLIAGATSAGIGERLPQDMLTSAEAAGYLNDMAASEVAKIMVADDGTMTMQLRPGGRVEYGPATELQQKADALAGIITWAEDNHTKIRSADLTAPDAPAAKVQKPQGE